MKLSAFPNFPDPNPTTPTPGAGAASGAFTNANVNSGSPAREPGPYDSPADFAAIIGDITGSIQGARDLPSLEAKILPPPSAMGLLPDALQEARPFGQPVNEAGERETNPESCGTVISGANGSCISVRAKMEKSRPPNRDDPRVDRPRGLTPENPAWATLLATPAPIAAAPAPGCDLPLPADPDTAPLGEEPSPQTDSMPLFPGLPNNSTPARSMPESGAGERGRARGIEHRSWPNRSSSSTATPESQRPTNVPRFAIVDCNPAESHNLTPSPEPTLESTPRPPGVATSDTANVRHVGKEWSSAPESAIVHPAQSEVEAPPARDRAATESLPSPSFAPSGMEQLAPEVLPSSDDASNHVLDTSDATPSSAVAQASKVMRSSRAIRPVPGEKISGLSAEHRPDGAALDRTVDKTSLSTSEPAVMEQRPVVGTAGANLAPPMSASQPVQEANATTADAALASAFDRGMMADAESIESTAQNTVETILALADRVASADGQSVQLRFSIGDNDLRVHVGYSGDEVRTTFHTESPELRAALLQEWQSLNPAGTDRATVRFADPVFASGGHSDQGASNSSFDSPSHQQRETAGRREAGFAPAGFGRSPHLAADSTTPASGAPARGLEPARSTQRLHTFA